MEFLSEVPLVPCSFTSMIYFTRIKQANLNAYADDKQLYSSDKDRETLNRRLQHELTGMTVNPDKHLAEVLGADSNDYEFSFLVYKNSIHLLRVTIDKDFSFNRLTSHKYVEICGKVNHQFSVIKRF